MTITITADVTFRHGTQLYTADQSYDVADSLAHLFMVRKWASGTTSGAKSVTMAEDWREGATLYATGETYTIDQPLADFLIEIGLATAAGLPTTLLDLIAAADENSWIQANTNLFSDVWPASDYRPKFNSGVSSPATILNAWASFAWDDTNHRLILWGGGHANSNCNEPYDWSAFTRHWRLSYYPADVVDVGDGDQTYDAAIDGMGIETVDWPSTPQSSHTYDTQHWLPILQRFCTLGGAANTSGGPFRFRETDPGGARIAGCFLLDMAQAGTGKVAGTAGSNVHRNTTVGVDLDGAEAWSLRDWFLDHADPNSALSSLDGGRTNAAAAYAEENGHDVIYYKRGPANLVRIEFVDDDYLNDIISVAGQGFTTLASAQGAAIDTANNIFVSLINATNVLAIWDLSTQGPTNKDVKVPAANIGGADASEFLTQLTDEADKQSIEYDEQRGRFVIWGRGGRVWALEHSGATLTTGWTVTKLADDTLTTRPLTASELTATSQQDAVVGGKWRRAKTLDVYIGVQKINDGNVWIFKPANWVDPR